MFVRHGRLAAVLVAVVVGSVAGVLMPLVADRERPAGAAEGVLERPDDASASALARQTGQPVEVTGRRSADTETIANADGTFTFRSYVAPVRVRRGDGWAPIDTTLVRTGDGGVSPRATVSDLQFSGGGTGPAVRLGKGGRELALSWPGSLPAPVLSGDTATYAEVLPGVDLHLRAEADGFAKVLVVKDRQAAANAALRSLRFGVSLVGLTLRDRGEGVIEAVDGAGVPVFVSPGSFQWDSSGSGALVGARGPTYPAATDGLRRSRMAVSAAVDAVTVTPDAAMLSDPGTMFPVFIDPPFTGLTDKWGHVCRATPDSTSCWGSNRDSMRVGRVHGGGTNDVWRTLVRINISPIVGQGLTVMTAHFYSMLDHSASCSGTAVSLWWTDFPAPNSTWNQTNSFGQAGFWNTDLGFLQLHANETMPNSCSGGVQPDMLGDWGAGALKAAVQGMVGGGFGIMSFGLKAVDETDDTKWKRFYPADSSDANLRTRLEVVYDKAPNAPAPQALSTTTDCYLACVSPAVVRTTTPTLKVGVSDPVGPGNTRTVFEVRAAASDTAALVVDNAAAPVLTGAPGNAAWPVPSGKLASNTTYYWRAKSIDENNMVGPWSGWQTLSVDITPPGVSSVGSTQYPFKQWGAVVNTPGTFTLQAGSDVNEFTWWIDGGSTTTVTATGTNTKTAPVSHTPATDLVHTLHVTAKDIAGNVGSTFDYQFWVSPVSSRCWYWRLDETSGSTAADSGKAICSPTDPTVTSVAAALSGSYTWGPGHINNAVTLTGGRAGMGQPVVDTNKSYTVTAWVKPTALELGDQTIVSQDGTSASRFKLHYDADANAGAGGWCFSMRTGDNGILPVSACATGTVPDDLGLTHPPQDNVWVHLAGVYNAGTGKLQVHVMGNPILCSGEMVEASFAGTWPTTGQLVIGRARYAGADVESWRGSVDEMRVYPIALSPAVICQLAGQ